jgi:hypothetical protein
MLRAPRPSVPDLAPTELFDVPAMGGQPLNLRHPDKIISGDRRPVAENAESRAARSGPVWLFRLRDV